MNIQKPKAISNQKTDRSKTAPIETEFVKIIILLIIEFRCYGK